MNLSQRKLARVLFDEFHSESWSISPAKVREMQPEDPSNASYELAAAELAARDFTVSRNTDSPLDSAILEEADLLVLAHPCDPRWERTTSANSPALSTDEIGAVLSWVRAGGGLLVITEYEHAKYGDNLNELLAPAGLRVANGRIFDRGACAHENPEWILAAPGEGSPLGHLAPKACFYRASWCVAEGAASLAWKASPGAYPPRAGVIGTAPLGAGRVVVVTDSLLFGDERLQAFHHRQLWMNIAYWLAAPAFRRCKPHRAPSPAVQSQHWLTLKTAVNTLRQHQLPNGSVDPLNHAVAHKLSASMAAALEELAPFFPHQSAYFGQLGRDLGAWRTGGFGKPNFGPSLAAFAPQTQRHDGAEHLVLFPLYTPNACSDTRFEALLTRTPWPEWLARIERTGFRNEKFVPGQLLDFTDGYASECAVLFPETVSLEGRPSNDFGVIFCDREARRLQAHARRAAQAVGLALPPDMECWLEALPLVQDTVALWDLVHDRAHALGELPFDPFMIRQRAPFWMYGLEELRVDLRSFGETALLAADGFPFARYAGYAILLDRIFRFPLTGPRKRNYDALGGQLLFAYLHQKDVLLWRDNRLSVCWEALAEGMAGLREELSALYKLGADCSKLSFWLAAHDLVSRYVRPNLASKWKASTRQIDDESDVRKWLGLVHEDEFPLGNFHVNLQRKLQGMAAESGLERPAVSGV